MHPSLATSARKPPSRCTPSRPRTRKAWLARQKRSRPGDRVRLCRRRRASWRALPDAKGGIAAGVLGLGKGKDAFALAALAEKLPAGIYRLGEVPDFCGGANARAGLAAGRL